MKTLLMFLVLLATVASSAQTINRFLKGEGTFKEALAERGDKIEDLLKRLEAAPMVSASGNVHTSYDLLSYRIEVPRQLFFRKLAFQQRKVFELSFGKLQEFGTSSCSSLSYGQVCYLDWEIKEGVSSTRTQTTLKLLVSEEESVLVITSITFKFRAICDGQFCGEWDPQSARRVDLKLSE